MADEQPNLTNGRRPTSQDRLPPNDSLAEQAVLGCILLDPQTSIPECVSRLKAGSETFYDLRHQTIYDTLLELSDAGSPIDLITLRSALASKQVLDQVGGLSYISALPDASPSAHNLAYYLGTVVDRYLLRRMLAIASDTAAQVYDTEDGDAKETLEKLQSRMMSLTSVFDSSEERSIRELVHDSLNDIELYVQNQGKPTGVNTGIHDLDKLTMGLQMGDMIVLAARPSVGKTSLAMQIAEYAATESRIPVGVFSLEMTARSLITRMICSRARVNVRSVMEGFLVERDMPRLSGSAGALAKAPLFIDDSGGLSILQLKARARRMAKKHGIKLLVVDYLQLLHSESRRADNRQQEIAQISGGLKALAKELNVPVLVLSQLNRETEKEKRKPRVSDLRESGAIEQDADVICLLHKPSAEGKEDGEEQQQEDALPVDLILAKQRNGPTGRVRLTFLRGITRFEAAARISDDEAKSVYNPGGD